nr:hypothetical protein Iba_chr12bCG16350 [Ipomoea batatas]
MSAAKGGTERQHPPLPRIFFPPVVTGTATGNFPCFWHFSSSTAAPCIPPLFQRRQGSSVAAAKSSPLLPETGLRKLLLRHSSNCRNPSSITYTSRHHHYSCYVAENGTRHTAKALRRDLLPTAVDDLRQLPSSRSHSRSPKASSLPFSSELHELKQRPLMSCPLLAGKRRRPEESVIPLVAA